MKNLISRYSFALFVLAVLVSGIGFALYYYEFDEFTNTASSDKRTELDESLIEVREINEIARGVTHTNIRKGYLSDQAFYTVEMGIFEDINDGENLQETFIKQGFTPTILEVSDNFYETDLDKEIIGYVLQIAKFSNEEEARLLAEKLNDSQLPQTRIVYSEYDGTNKSTGPWNINILEINIKTFTGSIQKGMGNDQITDNEQLTSISSRKNAVAAVNGGYFVINNEDGIPGTPAGVSVLKGQLISESIDKRTSLILVGNEASIAETYTLLALETENGAKKTIDGINRIPGVIRSCGGTGDYPSDSPMHDVTCTDENELIQFSSIFGETTPEGEGYEVVLNENGTILYTDNKRGNRIPEEGFVLSATGTTADWLKDHTKKGQTITLINDLFVDQKPASLYNEIQWRAKIIKGRRYSYNC